MSFIWPPNPTPGQRVTGPYGEVYQWDAIAWSLVPGGTGGGSGGDFVEAPGDGRLYGRNGQLTQWQPVVPAAGGAFTGAVSINSTANASQPAQLGLGGQGISYLPYAALGQNIAFLINGGALYVYQNGTNVGGAIAGQTWVNQNALLLGGGTMNGDIHMGVGSLFLGANATSAMQPVTLQQLQGGWLPLSGGHLTGPLTSATTGASTPTLENLPTLDFLGSTINFQRRITNATAGAPAYGGIRVFLDNQSANWVYEPWGADNGPTGLYVQATTHPGSTGSTNGFQSSLLSQGGNPYTSQDVAGAFNITKIGQNSTWTIATQSQDNTGLTPGAFAQVGIEVDLLANGPDTAGSLYDPLGAARYGLYIAAKVNPTNTWAASTYFAAGTIVTGTSGVVPTCYIAQNAGTTGASQPAWPASGTVTDGQITWTTGVAQAVTLGTGIYVGGGQEPEASNVTINTVFGTDANVGNACIDLSAATLTGVNAAGIRMHGDMFIDVSANGTNAGKNQRIFGYSNYFAGLIYAAPTPANLVMLLGNDGSALFNGRMLVAAGPDGNLAGDTTGYNDTGLTIGRNQAGVGNINLITGAQGLSLYSTNGSGTIGTPYASFGGAGISVGANKVIGPQIAGWGAPTGGTRTASFPGASATLAQTSATLAQLIADMRTHGLLGA